MEKIVGQLDVFQVDYPYPICKVGYMRPDGDKILLKCPPLFPHICNKCGHEMNLSERYPTIRYFLKED